MRIHKFFYAFFWIGLISASGILLAQVFRPGMFVSNIGVSPLPFILFFLLMNLFFRFFYLPLGELVYKFLYLFATPFLTLAAIFLRLLELSNYPNYVFTTFRIDPTNLSVLSLFFVALIFINASVSFVRNHYQYVVFLLPLFLYHTYLLYFRHPALYEWMRWEDSVFEYLTMVVYIVAAIVCFKAIKKIKKRFLPSPQRMMLFVVFGVFFLGSIFVAGEEISWGQRIVGLETPESIAEKNAQKETNLHNMHVVAPHIYLGYGIFGLYCMLSWIVRKILSPVHPSWVGGWLRIISPNWYLFLFFLPMVIYAFSRDHVTNRHEELSELFLGVGVLLFFVEHYVRILSYFPKKFIKR